MILSLGLSLFLVSFINPEAGNLMNDFNLLTSGNNSVGQLMIMVLSMAFFGLTMEFIVKLKDKKLGKYQGIFVVIFIFIIWIPFVLNIEIISQSTAGIAEWFLGPVNLLIAKILIGALN